MHGTFLTSEVMENLEKSWNFKNGYFQAWKSPKYPKGFGKFLDILNIHMFIYAEFAIIHVFKRKAL